MALISCRARCFPLPDGPGQVKLPVGQVDLDRFFFFISYKQIEEFKNSWSRASDDFEKRRALSWDIIMLKWAASQTTYYYVPTHVSMQCFPNMEEHIDMQNINRQRGTEDMQSFKPIFHLWHSLKAAIEVLYFANYIWNKDSLKSCYRLDIFWKVWSSSISLS